eukprot:5468739-Amphidinium_carterae.1
MFLRIAETLNQGGSGLVALLALRSQITSACRCASELGDGMSTCGCDVSTQRSQKRKQCTVLKAKSKL